MDMERISVQRDQGKQYGLYGPLLQPSTCGSAAAMKGPPLWYASCPSALRASISLLRCENVYNPAISDQGSPPKVSTDFSTTDW